MQKNCITLNTTEQTNYYSLCICLSVLLSGMVRWQTLLQNYLMFTKVQLHEEAEEKKADLKIIISAKTKYTPSPLCCTNYWISDHDKRHRDGNHLLSRGGRAWNTGMQDIVLYTVLLSVLPVDVETEVNKGASVCAWPAMAEGVGVGESRGSSATSQLLKGVH